MIVKFILVYLLIGAIYGAWSWDLIVKIACKYVDEDKDVYISHGIPLKMAKNVNIIINSVVTVFGWPFFIVIVCIKVIKTLIEGERK